MKIEAKKLAELNKQYNKLGKDEKIISIGEVKKKLDDIIEKIESLEDLLSEQMDAIEIFPPECDDEGEGDSCGCGDDDDVEQTELYDLYSDLEDVVICGKFYKAIRMISLN